MQASEKLINRNLTNTDIQFSLLSLEVEHLDLVRLAPKVASRDSREGSYRCFGRSLSTGRELQAATDECKPSARFWPLLILFMGTRDDK